MNYSIIIPVYNVEKYLIECIESLNKQTFKDFEAILIDDGSKDGSGALCDELVNEYPNLRIKVFHQQNAGQIAARQKGMELAEGDYCLFLDSDDTFTPNALQIVTDAVNKYKADIVIFNSVRHIGNDYIPFWSHYSNKDLFLEGAELSRFYTDVISSNRFNNICFKAIKSSLLKKVDKYQNVSYIRQEEDYLMQLSIFDNVNSIVYIPHNIYIYRYNNESITNVKTFDANVYKAGLFIYKEKMKYAKKWGINDGEAICGSYLLGKVVSAIRQYGECDSVISLPEMTSYIKDISESSTFRYVYANFDGHLKTKVGRVVLWLMFHRFYRLAIYMAKYIPKIYKK